MKQISIILTILILGLVPLFCLADEEKVKTNEEKVKTNEEKVKTNEIKAKTDERPDKPYPVSITVSGGVSLGAYQAGYLYYLTELFKQNKDVFDFKLITGASAGTINALLALVSYGMPPEKDPEKSIFYKSWTSFTFKELFDEKSESPSALSSRDVLKSLATRIEKIWMKGISTDVDVVMAATATRLEDHMTELSDGYEIPRQEEKFVFRIRGMGKNNPPEVVNYVDSKRQRHAVLLPFSQSDDKKNNFNVIKQVLFASSAFLFAFPPQEVDYCLSETDSAEFNDSELFRECPEPTRKDLFIDGSILDKTPLRLAYKTAAAGLSLSEDGKYQWMEKPDSLKKDLPDDKIYFIHLDSSNSSYPDAKKKKEMDPMLNLFPAFGVFMKNWVRSTRSRELLTLLEEHPEIRNMLWPNTRKFPTASGQLLNFFGFFDRAFRDFDFYLGMYDAKHFIEKHTGKDSPFNDMKISFPEPQTKLSNKSWNKFFCMRAWFDEKPEYLNSCKSADMKDFNILMQTSLDKLYDICSRYPYDQSMPHLHCKQGMNGKAPPSVTGVLKLDENEWKQNLSDGENRFEYMMRLLKNYEFHFADLGLERDEASLASSRLREEILRQLDKLAKKQPFRQRTALRIVGKPAFNFFIYAPPKAIFYIGMGKSGEVGWSATWIPPHWLRINFALQIQGFDSFLSDKDIVMAFTPYAGFELEISPLSGPLVQVRTGIRAGYQFSTSDRFHSRECLMDKFGDSALNCSAPVGQFLLAVVLYERLRIQLGIEWLPKWLPPMSSLDKHIFNATIQLGWQWFSPF